LIIELHLLPEEKIYLTPGLKQALRRGAGHEKEKAGGRDIIFTSTEPVTMNNKLPARGEGYYFITATRRNEIMTSLFSVSSAPQAESSKRVRVKYLTPDPELAKLIGFNAIKAT